MEKMMARLNNQLLEQYEKRFGMTFSLFSVDEHNAERVNELMQQSLQSGEPFYDRYFATSANDQAI